MNNAVLEKINDYPQKVKEKLLSIRALILNEAESSSEIGELEETLKWGEPSYLTNKSKSGTTIRIDWKEKNSDEVGFFVNCKTTLLDQYRSMFPDVFRYEGERAVWIQLNKPLPEFEIRECIRMALRYHLDKNRAR